MVSRFVRPTIVLTAGVLALGALSAHGSTAAPDPASAPTAPARAADPTRDGVWSLIPPPGSRQEHTIVYDPLRRRMILFGGNLLGDVWALSLDEPAVWSHLLTQGTAPGTRRRHSAVYDPAGDRMIVYGGNDNTSNLPVGDVWALTLSGTPTWSRLQPSGALPPARQNHGAVYDSVGRRMLIVGGDNVSTAFSDVWALTLGDAPAWTQVVTSGTGPRGKITACLLDPVRRRLVAAPASFVGLLQVFKLPLDAPAWSLSTASGVPGDRNDYSLVYDPFGDRALLFGGSERNDVWALRFGDPDTWSALSPGGTLPAGRSKHRALCDPVAGRMLIFGGSTYTNDCWALALRGSPAWSQLVAASVTPPARTMETVVYDASRGRSLLFGGFSGSTNCCNDTWSYSIDNAGRWTALTPPAPLPERRFGHSAIYDPVRDRLLVYGGRAGATLDDVWALSLSGSPAWTRLSPLGPTPGGHYSHTAVYDPVRDRMIVFGGYNASVYGDDNSVWALTLSGTPRWDRLLPAGTLPDPRERHVALYDPLGDRMLVFGGQYGPPLDDLWALTLAGTPAWTKLSSGVGPAGRMDLSAVYDSDHQRMLIYGGLGSNNARYSDVWAWGLGASPGWTLLQPTGFPISATTNHAATYDPTGRRMIAFLSPDLEGFTTHQLSFTDWATPVRLWFVGSSVEGGRVRLAWEVSADGSAVLERRTEGSPWSEVARRASGAGGRWELEDASVSEGLRYLYRLRVSARDGEIVSAEVAVEVPAAGSSIEVRPNPTATGQVVVRFALGSSAAGRLDLLDVAGRVVASRDLSGLGPGPHEIALGPARLAPGVYLARLEHGGRTRVARTVVTR